jgi:hypothetical protein
MGFDCKYSVPQMFLHPEGPDHDLSTDSVEKYYLTLFSDDKIYEWVAQSGNKYASYC